MRHQISQLKNGETWEHKNRGGIRTEELRDREKMWVCNLIWCVSFWPEDSCSLTHAIQFNGKKGKKSKPEWRSTNHFRRTGCCSVWNKSRMKQRFSLHATSNWINETYGTEPCDVRVSVCIKWSFIFVEFSSVSELILAPNHNALF